MIGSSFSGPFQCGICRKSYKHSRSLRKHERFECQKEPQFTCMFCPYKAKLRGNLRKHIMVKHREEWTSGVAKIYVQRIQQQPSPPPPNQHLDSTRIYTESDLLDVMKCVPFPTFSMKGVFSKKVNRNKRKETKIYKPPGIKVTYHRDRNKELVKILRCTKCGGFIKKTKKECLKCLLGNKPKYMKKTRTKSENDRAGEQPISSFQVDMSSPKATDSKTLIQQDKVIVTPMKPLMKKHKIIVRLRPLNDPEVVQNKQLLHIKTTEPMRIDENRESDSQIVNDSLDSKSVFFDYLNLNKKAENNCVLMNQDTINEKLELALHDEPHLKDEDSISHFLNNPNIEIVED
ncbi:unnamed protein product [Phaedon cochleariae]|uniref:C2H2-type domain-containing protein n=1 Tax=Phaedon cochleariae TaxID=80249 RepID=A0A9N9X041_PHACE|nr:unnamed protein product [Phaedon cochleariae]